MKTSKYHKSLIWLLKAFPLLTLLFTFFRLGFDLTTFKDFASTLLENQYSIFEEFFNFSYNIFVLDLSYFQFVFGFFIWCLVIDFFDLMFSILSFFIHFAKRLLNRFLEV